MPERSANPKLDTLVAKFDKEAAALARSVDLKIEKILSDYVESVYRMSPKAALALRERVLLEIDLISLKAYGPGSVFEKLCVRYLGTAGRSGRERFLEHATELGYRAKLRLASIDAATVFQAATDTYAIAARYLSRAAVDELRQALVEEMIRGGGEKALLDRLVASGYIRDLALGKRVLRGEVRAAMMARTEPHRLANATYNAQAQEVEPNSEDRYYRWISALGPTVGEDSLRRHGTILSEREWETTDFGDRFSGLPPIRPNDNCSYIFYPRRALPPDLRKVVATTEPGEARRTVGTGDGPLWEKLYAEKIEKKTAKRK